MERTQGLRLQPVDRRLLKMGALALLAIANLYLLVTLATSFPIANIGADWTWNYAPAARFVLTHGPFGAQSSDTAGYVSRYSPVLAYGFAILLPLGVAGWTALHFVALAALPRRLAILAAISLPFWADVWAGNIMIFVLVAAVAALDGKRWGIVAFLALAVLAPRPLMIPGLVYLLWTNPWSRRALPIIFVLHAALVLVTGLGPGWVQALLHSGEDVGGKWDFGPGNLIGSLWIPVGLALAAWFTYRRRIGIASLAASPYWLLQYGLMLLIEWHRPIAPAARDHG